MWLYDLGDSLLKTELLNKYNELLNIVIDRYKMPTLFKGRS